MTKYEQFLEACKPYINKDGYIGGNQVAPDSGRNSDNGIMFCAEQARISHDVSGSIPIYLHSVMEGCLRSDGVLLRYHDDDVYDDSPDNYLGFTHFCALSRRRDLADRLYRRGVAGFGSYSSKWTKEGFLWRQLQLIFAVRVAAGRAKWYKPWDVLLAIYSALVLLVAGIKAPTHPLDDLDARRLSWQLLMTTQRDSLLCRLAGKVWWRRIRRHYGDEGMRVVFGNYFQNMQHPFALFAKNDWEK